MVLALVGDDIDRSTEEAQLYDSGRIEHVLAEDMALDMAKLDRAPMRGFKCFPPASTHILLAGSFYRRHLSQ